jgi:trans-2,3-dihydro-3-hydroxyanthranilate isomerase
MSNRYAYTIVDVFTRRRFGGNQLAVFTDARGMTDDEMQSIAIELKFSESTFVLPPEDARSDARVRIFTPGRELPFAGHPTVGTAFVLGCQRHRRELRLELGVGPIDVRADAGDGEFGSALMEQPIPRFEACSAEPAEVAAMLRLDLADLHPTLPIRWGSAGVPFLYVPLASLAAVKRASGDLDLLRSFFGDHDHPCTYLFALETVEPGSASHGRMFALTLGSGVNEDPATGGAAGPLAGYLVLQRAVPPGKMVLEQGYEMGRPSQIEAIVNTNYTSDDVLSRVAIGGGVVKVAEGTLMV